MYGVASLSEGGKPTFNNLSSKYRKKMLLHVFVYSPLEVIAGTAIGMTVVEWAGMRVAAVPILLAVVTFIFVKIRHLSKMYEEFRKKSSMRGQSCSSDQELRMRDT